LEITSKLFTTRIVLLFSNSVFWLHLGQSQSRRLPDFFADEQEIEAMKAMRRKSKTGRVILF